VAFPALEHVCVKDTRVGLVTRHPLFTCPKLRSIELSIPDDSSSWHTRTRPKLRLLTISNWGDTNKALSDNVATLIRNNTHITHINTKMYGGVVFGTDQLLQHVLRPLAEKFNQLKSIFLLTDMGVLEAPVLSALGRLTTLVNIRIPVVSKEPAMIDHDAIRAHLGALQQLECLIIDGDVKAISDIEVDSKGKTQAHRADTDRQGKLAAEALAYAMSFSKLRVVVLATALFRFTRTQADDDAGDVGLAQSIFDVARIERILRGLKHVFRIDEYLV
jgi:hypothetical protein